MYSKFNESKHKADHILKMAGLWIFCDFVSLKNIDKIKLPRLYVASFLKGQRRVRSLINSYYSGLLRI